jgi:C4-dicarboxylate-specific signal transduction histidine kinase
MQWDQIHVLLIEDNEVDAVQVRRCLGEEPGIFRLDWVTTLQEGLDRLGKGEIDVVLLDLHLPDSQGVDTVVRLRERAPTLPVVVLTAAVESRIALGSLQAGGQDFLLKDELTIDSVLTRAIRYAIERQKIANEQRRLEGRVARAEKVASLGVLAAGVAVGFNRLLGMILEEADDAMELVPESPDPHGLRRKLNAVRQVALRAARMAEQLRDYAATGRSHATPMNIAEFVIEASSFLESITGEEIDITCKLSAAAPPVQARRIQLHEILTSLVTNACEAIGSRRGQVVISTGQLWADRELLARTHGSLEPAEGLYAFLQVRDDGSGISPDVLNQIFDPFFSTKFAGRGLGLAAVLGVLRELRAVVLVESQTGEGSSFTVLFPSTPAATRSGAPGPRNGGPSRAPRHRDRV